MNVSGQLNASSVPDGFTVSEIADFLFKKALWRTNTHVGTVTYNEPMQVPTVFAEQIATQFIPDSPPKDAAAWQTLSGADIQTLFGIRTDELNALNTNINGESVFSISQLIAYPYIYRILNCRLRSIINNPNYAFNAVTPITKKNILKNIIPFQFSNGAWNGKVNRTISGETIARRGLDIVLQSQVPFIVDFDSGTFTIYDPDSTRFTSNPMSAVNPPAISCYIYKGEFNNFLGEYSTGLPQIIADISGLQNAVVAESLWHTTTDTDISNAIFFQDGPVIIGADRSTDASKLLEVNGDALIQNVTAESFATFSDIRLKENIKTLKTPSNILNINTYSYNLIESPDKEEIGVIAQEVEKIFPQVVKTSRGYKSVQYDRLGVMLIPVVKEQSKRIEVLEQEMNNLKMLLLSGKPKHLKLNL